MAAVGLLDFAVFLWTDAGSGGEGDARQSRRRPQGRYWHTLVVLALILALLLLVLG